MDNFDVLRNMNKVNLPPKRNKFLRLIKFWQKSYLHWVWHKQQNFNKMQEIPKPAENTPEFEYKDVPAQKPAKAKIVLFLILGLFLLGWELARENAYITASYPITGWNFNNYLNDTGTLEIAGDWVTKGLNDKDKYTSPAFSTITCNLLNNNLYCKEIYTNQILGLVVPYEREYKTIFFNDEKIILDRLTPAQTLKMELVINLKTEEVTYTQIPLTAKTGNIFIDAGKNHCVSILTNGKYGARSINGKYQTNLLNTPILFIYYKITGQI